MRELTTDEVVAVSGGNDSGKLAMDIVGAGFATGMAGAQLGGALGTAFGGPAGTVVGGAIGAGVGALLGGTLAIVSFFSLE